MNEISTIIFNYSISGQLDNESQKTLLENIEESKEVIISFIDMLKGNIAKQDKAHNPMYVDLLNNLLELYKQLDR